jgi:chromosome segregation ATPase
MKKSIKALAITVLATGALFTACSSPEKKVDKANEKVEDAKENLSDAKEDLAKAKQDSLDEYNKYRAEWNDKIIKNDDKIAEYRKNMVTIKGKEAKAKAQKRVDELDRKNKEMKAKLDASKNDSNWEEFKREFNHDMDELGTAISDLFKNNEK